MKKRQEKYKTHNHTREERRKCKRNNITMVWSFADRDSKADVAQKTHALREEVDKLAQTIETDQTGAKDKIAQWWDELAKWVG
jgi:hypothetical protein